MINVLMLAMYIAFAAWVVLFPARVLRFYNWYTKIHKMGDLRVSPSVLRVGGVVLLLVFPLAYCESLSR